jgi:hypothetical protein
MAARACGVVVSAMIFEDGVAGRSVGVAWAASAIQLPGWG